MPVLGGGGGETYAGAAWWQGSPGTWTGTSVPRSDAWWFC